MTKLNPFAKKTPAEHEKRELPKIDVSLPEKKLSNEAGYAPEKEIREKTPEDKLVIDKLMQEVSMMEKDENSKMQAAQQAQKIQFFQEEEKLKYLLKIAQNKGVVVAIQVARNMNEPYLLDSLHDLLAKEGYYKKFTK